MKPSDQLLLRLYKEHIKPMFDTTKGSAGPNRVFRVLSAHSVALKLFEGKQVEKVDPNHLKGFKTLLGEYCDLTPGDVEARKFFNELK